MPSSSLIPHDPSLLLTAAGMVQFKPYMLGDEVAPYARAASIQKCFRTTDIDRIGVTDRHFTFFEMLGNFSFGDYFKAEAIPWAWELVTEVWGLDPALLWVTVFETDTEAAAIWTDSTEIDPSRIVRMGKEDNFWDMGAAGPCGPCSEIYFDRGPDYGKSGGPAVNEDRYVELWNLVFMQDVMDRDGQVVGELPRKNIDTGAGLDRVAMVLQGAPSVFETDLAFPLLEQAQSITGVSYRKDPTSDISLRVLTDHARAVTFLIADGVFPTNEDRGYVLRRILRRAVRHARLLGTEANVIGPLVETTIEIFGAAYPELSSSRDFVLEVATREEIAFSRTLASGLEILDSELGELSAGETLSGEVAFKLHDTYGFPIDLTREVASENGCEVDQAAFDSAMEEQRERGREAARKGRQSDETTEAATLREILDEHGPTRFTGYGATGGTGTILAILREAVPLAGLETGERAELVADATPFYGEAGGQVGDTGEITTQSGRARVLDTTHPLPDLIAHRVEVVEGHLVPGQEAHFAVDAERRNRIRRNHTATHVLHWALREVLGDHVKQAGSLVAPDRLRFDFNHFSAPTAEELREVEAMANAKLLTNQAVRAFETGRGYAEEIGAIAFFGDKYGDVVRVLEAGDFSRELCGGTHVDALGEIGLIRVISEGSIGSNTRRIEAMTGESAVSDLMKQEVLLHHAAGLLKANPADLPAKIEKLIGEQKRSEETIREMRRRLAASLAEVASASSLVEEADGAKVVVARLDEPVEMLREVGLVLRDRDEVDIAVLGSSAGEKASLVSVVSRRAQEAGVLASQVIAGAAKALGGGGGKGADLAIAGGPKVLEIDTALKLAATEVRSALANTIS